MSIGREIVRLGIPTFSAGLIQALSRKKSVDFNGYWAAAREACLLALARAR
jgi:hypothetical protein